MDQKLFEEKLSEVCVWTRKRVSAEAHHGRSLSDTEHIEPPTELVVESLKPRPCPYIEGNTDCKISARWWPSAKHGDQFIRRCSTCSAIITPRDRILYTKSWCSLVNLVMAVDRKE
jgi:hypothetical protein